MQTKITLNNIQLLRAIAALLVLLHHALPHYQVMGETLVLIDKVAYWGFMGVDIFFVISGFIMAYTTFHKPRTLQNSRTFLKHRLFRIYLGYWPFLLFAFLLFWFTNPAKIPSFDLVGSFFLLNTTMSELLLPISWSLSYELYFYFLFLFSFLFSLQQLYRVIPLLTLLILTLVLIAHSTTLLPSNFFYSPYLLEFFGGVLLYQFKEYLMRWWVLVLSIVVIVVAYGYGIHYESKNGLYRILTFGVGAFFLTLMFLILEQKNIYSANRYAIALGDASYTLYLSHLIIINLFYFMGFRAFFSGEGVLLPLLGLCMIIFISITFSLLYYKFIEKPLYTTAIKGT